MKNKKQFVSIDDLSDTKLIFTGVTQGPNIENQGSIQYLSKSPLFSKKWAPKISQPLIQSYFLVFCIKISKLLNA